jgi:HNH endonuclease
MNNQRSFQSTEHGWLFRGQEVTASYQCLGALPELGSDFAEMALDIELLGRPFDQLKHQRPEDHTHLLGFAEENQHCEQARALVVLQRAKDLVSTNLSKWRDQLHRCGSDGAAELFDPGQQRLRKLMLLFHCLWIETDKIYAEVYGDQEGWKPPAHRENASLFKRKNRALFADGLPDSSLYVIPDKHQSAERSSWKSWRAPFDNNTKFNFGGKPYGGHISRTGRGCFDLTAIQIQKLKENLAMHGLKPQWQVLENVTSAQAEQFRLEHKAINSELNHLRSGGCRVYGWEGVFEIRKVEIVQRFLGQGGRVAGSSFVLIDGWTGEDLKIEDAEVDHVIPLYSGKSKGDPALDRYDNFVITHRRINFAKRNRTHDQFFQYICSLS